MHSDILGPQVFNGARTKPLNQTMLSNLSCPKPYLPDNVSSGDIVGVSKIPRLLVTRRRPLSYLRSWTRRYRVLGYGFIAQMRTI